MSFGPGQTGGDEPDWHKAPKSDEPSPDIKPPKARGRSGGSPDPSWAQDDDQDKRSPPRNHSSNGIKDPNKPAWMESSPSRSPTRSYSYSNPPSETDSLLPTEHPPSVPCGIMFFRAVSFIAVLTALVLLGAQATTLVLFFEGRRVSPLHIPQCVVRIYGTLLCIFAVLIEAEVPRSVAATFLCQNWVCRGIFYGFLGVLALEELDEWNAPDGWDSELLTLAGLAQASVGILYALMGIACMKGCRDRGKVNYAKAVAEYEVREAYRQQLRFEV
mmetsp:Transcript_13259/g.39431  ORF Transcript_13259/g.39431 Transcript_13259/m.39431 type:complete len:273 (-) Transcript_13259:109-927(-)